MEITNDCHKPFEPPCRRRFLAGYLSRDVRLRYRSRHAFARLIRRKPTQKDSPMFNSDFANRLFAAAFSVVLSASVFAYAIIPGSPAIA